jgi:hypothetical protein
MYIDSYTILSHFSMKSCDFAVTNQTNGQTNGQKNNQTNKQTHKQSIKQTNA